MTGIASVRQMSASRKQRPAAARPGGAAAARPTAKPVRTGPTATARKPARPAARPKAAVEEAAVGVVVGPVPVLSRVAGALAVLGVLLRLAVPAIPLAHAGALDLGGGNAFDWIALLPVVAVVGGAGVLCALGRLPRLGLATLLTAGTATAGLLLITGYRLDSADRSSQDLQIGVAGSFHYTVGGGLLLLLIADAVLVAAFLAASLAWSRTGMEDEGRFDGLRPKFATAGLVAGLLGAVAVGMPQLSSSVPGAAAPSLLEQDGLALLGGVVLALAVAGWGAIAATLRPRLAAVGGFAGLAGVLGTEALRSALTAARSPVVGAGPGTITELLAAAAFALLAVGAWRLSGRPAPVEDEIS
ncbi:MAG: iron complex transport system permease protein [Mycobacteriales bacterium]